MKKKILIILFLCVYFPIKAQNSIRLIDILLDFCQEITQENPSEEKMYYIFQSISPEKVYFLPNQKKSNLAGFTKEKVAFTDLKGEKYDENALLSFYTKGDKKAYTLIFSINSRYSVIKGEVCYDKAKYPISFPELTEKIGSVFYDPIFQAKDTKKSNYIYQNPKTYRKVVLSIQSYNPPEAEYNIIYRIEIKDIHFFDESSLAKNKFYIKD